MIECIDSASVSLVSSVIVATFALIGTIASAKFVSNVRVVKLEMKMSQLEDKVMKHNQLIDRTYLLEKEIALLKEQKDKP